MWTRSQLQLQPQPQPFVVVCCTGAYDMYDIRWRWAEWGWKRFLDVAKKCWANLKWKLKKNGNETKMFRGVGEVPKRTISADPRQAHLPTIWNFGRVQISWHVQILGFQPPLNEFTWYWFQPLLECDIKWGCWTNSSWAPSGLAFVTCTLIIRHKVIKVMNRRSPLAVEWLQRVLKLVCSENNLKWWLTVFWILEYFRSDCDSAPWVKRLRLCPTILLM